MRPLHHKINTINIITTLCITLVFGFSSCKKFIEVDSPVTSVNAGNVYADNSTAASVLTSIYANMSNNFSNSGITEISLMTDLSADNLGLFDLSDQYYTQHYQNAINPDYTTGSNFWKNIYPNIYTCNAAIEGLSASKTLTAAVKQRLLGEAYFLRAFHYFYLVNLFGDVPLVLKTDYIVSNITPRTATATVYQQILADLNQSKDLLDDRYLNADILTNATDRTRPNRAAAYAMIARVHLYLKNYSAAEAAATTVINLTSLYSSNILLNQVFLKNSLETIWALQSVKAGFNTDEANVFILPAGGPNNLVNKIVASDQLMNSFETGDQRKMQWTNTVTAGGVTYPYVAKFKAQVGSPITEYCIVLRIAEQYLIRAEARAQQGTLATAISDVDIIRNRAGLSMIKNTNPNINQIDLLALIAKERREELFTEWGHRWFDLKRTGQIDAVMGLITPLKGGGSWKPSKSLYPIPTSEIKINSVLKQNPDYN